MRELVAELSKAGFEIRIAGAAGRAGRGHSGRLRQRGGRVRLARVVEEDARQRPGAQLCEVEAELLAVEADEHALSAQRDDVLLS